MSALFKILFALLLVANLVLAAAWFDLDQGLVERWLPKPPPAQADHGPWPLPPLSNAASPAGEGAAANLAASDAEADSAGAERLDCVIFGPFEDAAAAAAAAARISAAGGQAEATAEQIPPPNYMVYVEPAATAGEAARTAEELQSRAIDAFAIGSGALRNAVSVGVFSARDRAEAQRQRVADLGYGVAVHAPLRTAHRVVASNTASDFLPDTAATPCD